MIRMRSEVCVSLEIDLLNRIHSNACLRLEIASESVAAPMTHDR